MDGQQRRDFGQFSNKRPIELLSQTSDLSRRQRPRPMARRGQLETPVMSISGLTVRSSAPRKCGHYNKWHKGECRGLTRACYRCGAVNHYLKDCPKRNLPQTQKEKTVTQAREEQDDPDVI